MKSYQDISREDVPYIPEEVKAGLLPFVLYVPYEEYIFWFPEVNGKLYYGKPGENVTVIYEKRGPIEEPATFRRNAFKKGYPSWKIWKWEHQQIPLSSNTT